MNEIDLKKAARELAARGGRAKNPNKGWGSRPENVEKAIATRTHNRKFLYSLSLARIERDFGSQAKAAGFLTAFDAVCEYGTHGTREGFSKWLHEKENAGLDNSIV
jgi:hypothetical protein